MYKLGRQQARLSTRVSEEGGGRVLLGGGAHEHDQEEDPAPPQARLDQLLADVPHRQLLGPLRVLGDVLAAHHEAEHLLHALLDGLFHLVLEGMEARMHLPARELAPVDLLDRPSRRLEHVVLLLHEVDEEAFQGFGRGVHLLRPHVDSVCRGLGHQHLYGFGATNLGASRGRRRALQQLLLQLIPLCVQVA